MKLKSILDKAKIYLERKNLDSVAYAEFTEGKPKRLMRGR